MLSLPFLSAALALALAFRANAARAGALYRMDLMGAGFGALGMVFLLDALPLADALRIVGVVGAASGGIVLLWGRARRLARGGALLAVAAGIALPAALPDHWLRPHPSPYKGLSLALTAPDARIVAERHGPLGWLAAVESPTVPFRHAPGLSLMAPVGPPAQIGLFTDGGAPTAITRANADLRYLEAETAALPYHMLESPPRVLVLGAGGGAEVLRALHHGARAVDAVELNPDVLAIVREVLAGRPDAAWEGENVRMHVADARSFAARSSERWDLIQIALVDSFSAAAAGVHALDESLLYTVEALGTFLDRLAPDGVLAVTRWLKLPPRDALKLLWTARAALEEQGVADPASRLVMIRGWKTTTLVIGERPFDPRAIAGLRAFSDDYAFDLVWHPGIAQGDANRHNRLAEPEFYRGAAAILGPDPEDLRRPLQVRAQARDRRPPVLLPQPEVGDASRAARAARAGWPAAGGMGLRHPGRDPGAGRDRGRAPDPLAAARAPRPALRLARLRRPPPAGVSQCSSRASAWPSSSSRSLSCSASRSFSDTRFTPSRWCLPAFWSSPVLAPARLTGSVVWQGAGRQSPSPRPASSPSAGPTSGSCPGSSRPRRGGRSPRASSWRSRCSGPSVFS